MAEQKIQASHILVKHEGSRRLSSWRDEDGVQIKARTKEQAADILRGYLEKIKSGESTFEDIASRESDCGSAAENGNIGFFAEHEVQKPFYDAASKLKVGELSDIVYTDSGCHIIKRTG